MKTKGLPVSLKPCNNGLAANETHLIYPAHESQHFVLEELESGTTNTLEATGSGNPIKFVMSHRSVALLTDSVVLFWNLEGSPLESWNSSVEDIYFEYGNWNLVGPNVVFDPLLQESKSADINVPPKLVYRLKTPVWVGAKTNHLHVGDKTFDLGGEPISCITAVGHYIIVAHGVDITVLFDLKEVGRVEVDEEVGAIAGAIVDGVLDVYFITPTKVAQITADLDFDEITPVAGEQEDSKDVLVSGHFRPRDQHGAGRNHQKSHKGTEQESHQPSATTDSGPSDSGPTSDPSSDPSSDLLALLHKQPAPPRPPSTSSLPGAMADGYTLPFNISEDHVSHEDLKSLVEPKAAPPAQNIAKHSSDQSADYVSRDQYDSTVAALNREIEALKLQVLELKGAKQPEQQQQQAKKEQEQEHKQPQTKQQPKQPDSKSSATPRPASVADAVTKTLEGQHCLQYLKKNLDELSTYLNGAPVERAQLIKLSLIHAYHNTELSRHLIASFGPVVVEPTYYSKIIGEEYGH